MKKIYLIFSFILLIFSSASWSMLDLEEGTLYKIRNKYSGNVLNSWGREVGKRTATMETDVDNNNQYASHRLWTFVKVGTLH